MKKFYLRSVNGSLSAEEKLRRQAEANGKGTACQQKHVGQAHSLLYMAHLTTNEEFEQAVAYCRDIFSKKLHDYGAAWRVMHPETLTDQLFIKAARIRSIRAKGVALVDEGIVPEFAGIVNYSIIALIQLEKGTGDATDIDPAEALRLYDKQAHEALELMKRKNHDYNEAWREMRIGSFADLIYMKLFRTRQIEDIGGETLASEGVAANYMDMLNYAVFALIKLVIEHQE